MSATVTTIGPSAEEMEAEVLAACMVYPQCVDDALEAGLRDEDFDRAPRRTLNNAFVILDEAQNTTPEQMKMFLTRIGFGSRAVVTGDVSQIDLPKGAMSGLIDAERVLKRVKGIAITRFTSADVVRHPLVARIVDAYDAPRRAPAAPWWQIPQPSQLGRRACAADPRRCRPPVYRGCLGSARHCTP